MCIVSSAIEVTDEATIGDTGELPNIALQTCLNIDYHASTEDAPIAHFFEHRPNGLKDQHDNMRTLEARQRTINEAW